jgi:hypothetical protein
MLSSVGVPMCKRSNPTMEFALILLETELKAAAAYLSELTTRLQVGFCVCVCVCVCVWMCVYECGFGSAFFEVSCARMCLLYILEWLGLQ